MLQGNPATGELSVRALSTPEPFVRLFAQLGNENWTRYALAHRSIIDRFGRFPHRNAILGRTSTPDELATLDDPTGTF